MKRLTLTLIYMLCFTFCSKSKDAQDLQSAPKTQQIIIDKELGEGEKFNEFLNIIKIRDCNLIKKVLDEKVYFSLGEGIAGEFSQSNNHQEKTYNISLCDLFFDSDILQERISVLDGTNKKNNYFQSPSYWLEKSPEIRFIAMDETSAGNGRKVNVAFFGGRYSKPNTSSRNVDFMFRCPNGFREKCFLYSFSFE
ncbi:MAG: hypothetical protein SH817_05825 [Leptospira sp.]|nr:hypothetical protein [Leptospira sp.]